MAKSAQDADWIGIAGACRDAVNRAPHGEKVDVLREAAEEYGLSDSHVRRMIRALAFVEALEVKDKSFAQALRGASFRVAELIDRWSLLAPREAREAAQRFFDKAVNFKGLQALFDQANSVADHRAVSGATQLPDEYLDVALQRAKDLAGIRTDEVALDDEPRLAPGVDRLFKSTDGKLFAVIVTPPGLSPQAYAVRRKLDAGRIALHKLIGIRTIVVLPEEAGPAEFTDTLSIYRLQDTPVGVVRVRPQYYAE